MTTVAHAPALAPATAPDTALVRQWWLDREWHRLIPLVRAWARQSVPPSFRLSGDEIDDVISRVTVRVWTAKVVPDEPRMWVRVVALNMVRDGAKSSWSRGRQDEDAMAEHAGPEVADAWIEEADQRSRIGRLREALRKLPEWMRRCLVLHDLHGRTCQDIAAQVGITEGAVKMRLHRSRRVLAALYEDTPDVALTTGGIPERKRGRAAVRTWRELHHGVTPTSSPVRRPERIRLTTKLVLDPQAYALRRLLGAD
jgi:RNA polymerase sigma-70 factor (ECF subfamily)